MHIRRIELENIRSIKHLVWELPKEQDGAGWHVILGDNGSGKTSLVRAVALCSIGPKEVYALKQPWYKWLRSSETHSLIKLNFENKEIAVSWFNFSDSSIDNGREHPILIAKPDKELEENGIWDERRLQPIYSFGSSRRFSYLTSDEYNYFDKGDASSQHITAFDDSYSLTFGIEYLRRMYIQHLEKDSASTEKLTQIKDFINQSDILPNHVKLQSFNNDGVFFTDSNNQYVSIENLSDGYKSIISIIIDLIRNLYNCYGDSIYQKQDNLITVICEGIVQIDEADLHLHPTWQKNIGQFFKKHFPNIQFIVTTHSPIICQAADTVFVLPKPGTNEKGRFLNEEELNRVKYGNIQEAYMLDAFGEIDRSEEGQQKLKRLSEMNRPRSKLRGITGKAGGLRAFNSEPRLLKEPRASNAVNGAGSFSFLFE